MHRTAVPRPLYRLSWPTYIPLVYVYISVLADVAAQMPTWTVFRVAGLRLNWLCLCGCISLDPSSGSSPFWLMMRLVFVWTLLVRPMEEKCGEKDKKRKSRRKGIKTEVSSQSTNSWINMLFLVKNDLEHVQSVLSQKKKKKKNSLNSEKYDFSTSLKVCVVCVSGMWPGAYWRRVLRWQRPGSEVHPWCTLIPDRIIK